MTLLLAACGVMNSDSGKIDPQYGVAASPQLADKNGPIPKGGGVYKVGRPYQIAGNWYYPRENVAYDAIGVASWYGDDFHGRQTANGEVFDMNALTAAHPTLPMPTYVRVTNLENGRSVVVRVNDRGPFARGREIDLSRQTAKTLGMKQQGTSKVRVQYVGRAHLEGSDDNWLRTTYVDGDATGDEPLPQPARATESYGSQTGQGQSQLALAPVPQPQVRTVQTQIIRPGAVQPVSQRVAYSGQHNGSLNGQPVMISQPVSQTAPKVIQQPAWQQPVPMMATRSSPVATQVAPASTSLGVVPGVMPPSAVSGFASGFFAPESRIDTAFAVIERQAIQRPERRMLIPSHMDPAGAIGWSWSQNTRFSSN